MQDKIECKDCGEISIADHDFDGTCPECGSKDWEWWN